MIILYILFLFFARLNYILYIAIPLCFVQLYALFFYLILCESMVFYATRCICASLFYPIYIQYSDYFYFVWLCLFLLYIEQLTFFVLHDFMCFYYIFPIYNSIQYSFSFIFCAIISIPIYNIYNNIFLFYILRETILCYYVLYHIYIYNILTII